MCALGNPACALGSPACALGGPVCALGNPACVPGGPVCALGSPACVPGGPCTLDRALLVVVGSRFIGGWVRPAGSTLRVLLRVLKGILARSALVLLASRSGEPPASLSPDSVPVGTLWQRGRRVLEGA